MDIEMWAKDLIDKINADLHMEKVTLPSGIRWATPDTTQGFGFRDLYIPNTTLEKYRPKTDNVMEKGKKDSLLTVADLESLLSKPFGKANYWKHSEKYRKKQEAARKRGEVIVER